MIRSEVYLVPTENVQISVFLKIKKAPLTTFRREAIPKTNCYLYKPAAGNSRMPF